MVIEHNGHAKIFSNLLLLETFIRNILEDLNQQLMSIHPNSSKSYEA